MTTYRENVKWREKLRRGEEINLGKQDDETVAAPGQVKSITRQDHTVAEH